MLRYEKKQLDGARERAVPLFRFELDARFAPGGTCGGLGRVQRVGIVSEKTANAIMDLLDKDTER